MEISNQLPDDFGREIFRRYRAKNSRLDYAVLIIRAGKIYDVCHESRLAACAIRCSDGRSNFSQNYFTVEWARRNQPKAGDYLVAYPDGLVTTFTAEFLTSYFELISEEVASDGHVASAG